MTILCKKIFSLFTKKKPYIRFYSVYPGVIDLFPIIKSSLVDRKFLNKDLYPQHLLSTFNCPGLKKIVTTGFVIPAPADFEITTNGDGSSFSWIEPIVFDKGLPGTESYVSSHPPYQTSPLIAGTDTLHTTIKIETPWRVDASNDIVFIQMPVAYNNEDRFVAAIGILDPMFTHTLNIPMFWKQLNGTTLVKAGTPLCQLIPVLRKNLNLNEYDISINNADENDMNRERAYNFAANCIILEKDSLSARLHRASKILKKFKRRTE
jgi:hypothetical protein